jgi:XTP/dITP diphosphohydrolase
MKRLTLLVGTFNTHKLKEIGQILSDMPVEVIGLGDLEITIEEAEEKGDSFEANAVAKAGHYALSTGMITLADDSGLEIEALDGRPGLFSARYADTNEGRIEKVLGEMADVADEGRAARFVCAMALVVADQEPVVEIGMVEGVITRSASGGGGFGYDPIFYIPEAGMTMAELEPGEKNQISHRARAAEKIKPVLRHLADQLAD